MLARIKRWLEQMVLGRRVVQLRAELDAEIVHPRDDADYWRKVADLAIQETVGVATRARAEKLRLEAELEHLQARHRGLENALKAEREIRQREGQRLVAEREQVERQAQKALAAQIAAVGVGRYQEATHASLVCEPMVALLEDLVVGMYERENVLLITRAPLTEEQIADGWHLLGVQESVQKLRERTRMAMGVWN